MNNEHKDIAKMIYRLKTRLALANFKRQYGYEKYDLTTLESILKKPRRHRYYPTCPNSSQKHPHPPIQLSFQFKYPLSEKRSTFSIDEDNAAHVLVMLHNA